jgi:uncharacterized membrane protein
MRYILLYLSTTVIFFAIDMIWLGWLAKDFYWEKLDGILTKGEVNWAAAGVFYALYIGGIIYFGTSAGFREETWKAALMNGALFGFFCYATYDLTNMALIKNWPLQVVVVDILWGTFLTGSTALLSFIIGKNWLSF